MEEAVKIVIEMLCQHGQQSTQPFQRWLGAMSWMSIVSIILNLIVLLR